MVHPVNLGRDREANKRKYHNRTIFDKEAKAGHRKVGGYYTDAFTPTCN
jgi:hypothetical protein